MIGMVNCLSWLFTVFQHRGSYGGTYACHCKECSFHPFYGLPCWERPSKHDGSLSTAYFPCFIGASKSKLLIKAQTWQKHLISAVKPCRSKGSDRSNDERITNHTNYKTATAYPRTSVAPNPAPTLPSRVLRICYLSMYFLKSARVPRRHAAPSTSAWPGPHPAEERA
jgi:hypothetical protein